MSFSGTSAARRTRGAASGHGPGDLVGARFRLRCRIAGSEGVDTWLGEDGVSGGRVVVRLAARHEVPDAELLRLEFVGAQLFAPDLPHLAPVLQAGQDAGAVHLVRPWVRGTSLQRRLARRGCRLEEVVAIGRAVALGLAAAHARGVVLRMLTPSNVIVAPSAEAPGATIVDVALPRAWHVQAPTAGALRVARYLSPEAAGLTSRGVDERSDLYSLGVVLFECLTGHAAFPGEDVGAVLRAQLGGARPAPRELVPGLPRALEELVTRLLRADPRDRFQSAEAVAADLADVAVALAAGDADPAVPIGARDVRRTLTDAAFVGREDELGTILAALDDAAAGDGGLVTLEALSGGGKTRLLDEAAAGGVARGAWVLRGGGVDHAARLPFQVLGGVVRELLRALSGDPARGTVLAERLGEQAEAACAALPELLEFLDPPGSGSLGPEAHGAARSVRALVRLLDALGEPGRPALVLLDDCQWADELSLALLGRWAAVGGAGGARHVLVVAAFRTEEVPPEAALRRMPARSALALGALGPAEVRRLAESMAGPLPDDALEPVERLGGGSPFMVAAVLRGLVETRALVPGEDGWRLEDVGLERLGPSRAAAELLGRRIAMLSPDALAVLDAAAVLGKSFDPAVAAELAGLSSERALTAVGDARRRHIVWAHAAGRRWSFTHDKLREAVLEGLDPHRREALHRGAAARLERTRPDLAFEIAYHYDAAGERARALPYALAAAEAARARNALEVAEEQYRIADRGLGDDHPASRRVAEGLGDVLMLRGRYGEAREMLERAREHSTAATDRAAIEGKIGELAFKRGDVQEAVGAYERALRLLDRRVPRGRAAFAAAAAREVAVQTAHTLLPRLLVGRRSPQGAEQTLLAVGLYSRIAYPYWFGRGAVPTLWAHLRGMNLAERYRPTPELAQAYSEHAPVMTVIPLYRRGIEYAERGLAIRRDRGDVWGQGQSLHFYGVVLYAASRYRECIERCREAVRLLERTGDRWEINTANWHIGYCRYRLGDLAEAAQIFQDVHRDGLEIGDAQAAGISLSGWAKSTGGRVPAQAVAAGLAAAGEDAHTRVELLQAEGIRLLGEGKADAAADVLRTARGLVRERGLRQEYVAPVQPWLATALRQSAEAVSPLAPARRRRAVARAAAAARAARRVARRYPNNLPHALREAGLVAALRGRARRAERLLERSMAEARRQEARHEEALSRVAAAEVRAASGDPGAATELTRACAALAALMPPGAATGPDASTLSLAERFDSVLEVGGALAGALSVAAVHDAVRQAGVTLLRGQACGLLAPTDDGRLRPLRPDDESALEVAPEDLQAAARDGRARVSGPASEHGPPASAMIVPIAHRGAVVLLAVVTHGRAEGLFGDEEVRLADFIATLAGAALESAGAAADIAHRAMHDGLTGLANRALLLDRLGQALHRARRTGRDPAVLFIDLDDFKEINDSLGHAAGDELLVAVARRLRSTIRPNDTAARLGGDEFAVLLEETGDEEARVVAERLLEALRPPFAVGGQPIFVHASMGIAAGRPSVDADEILRDADVAMYMAKAGGKDDVRLFQPGMRQGIVDRLELRLDLEHALEREELFLVYQPIVDLTSRRPVGVEALVRWRHPERGVVMPSEFVPLAERTGWIGAIDGWVLARAAEQVRGWRALPGASSLLLHVNLSPRRLHRQDLVEEFARLIAGAGLDPSDVVVELTEGALMHEEGVVADRLTSLKALGLRVAVDDFGTGYSSLARLSRLPADAVKIDRSFVGALDGDDPQGLFIRAITDLAHGLGLEVIAEGVEHEGQLATLRALGCPRGQGFLLSRPLEEDAVERLLGDGWG